MKKKLFLNKQTITKLNILQQTKIKGGTGITDYACLKHTYDYEACDTEFTIVPAECGATALNCNPTDVCESDLCETMEAC